MRTVLRLPALSGNPAIGHKRLMTQAEVLTAVFLPSLRRYSSHQAKLQYRLPLHLPPEVHQVLNRVL